MSANYGEQRRATIGLFPILREGIELGKLRKNLRVQNGGCRPSAGDRGTLPPLFLFSFSQLSPSRLQALDDDCGHTLHHLVTEVVIGLAVFAEPRSIKEDRFCRNRCAGVEVPVVRREQPGPAEHVVAANGLQSTEGPSRRTFRAPLHRRG